MLLRLLISATLVFAAPRLGLGQAFQVRSIGLEEGLSQSSVSAIAQDSLGYVWMATQDGLNRYDGYDFEVFKKEPFDTTSLSGNRINALLFDRQGYLWIGTAFDGLNIMHPGTGVIRRIQHIEEDLTSLSSNSITRLIEDPDGRVWIGTANGFCQAVLRGASPLQDSLTFVRYAYTADVQQQGYSRCYVRDLLVRKNGEVWIAAAGTKGGVLVYEAMPNGVTVPREPFALEEKVGSVLSLGEDALGRVWLGTYHGLKVWDPLKEMMVLKKAWSTIDHEVSRIRRMRSGSMWLGSEHGLYYLSFDDSIRRYTSELRHFSADRANQTPLAGNMILAIEPDQLNPEGIWVGTYTGGANYLSRNYQPFFSDHLDQSSLADMSSASLTAILKDRLGILWLGTHEGLIRHDPTSGTYELFRRGTGRGQLKHDYILSLHEDRKGRLWVGLYDGLCEVKYDVRTGVARFGYVRSDCERIGAFSISETEEGLLAIGSFKGVALYDPDANEFLNCGKPLDEIHSMAMDYRVRAVYRDTQQRLWVGTNTGLILITGEGSMVDLLNQGAVQVFLHEPDDTTSLRSQLISGIVEDHRGRIWLGTMDGLLMVEELTGGIRFRAYTERDGLANNMIYAITANHNREELWISSNGGLTRFLPDSLHADNFHIQDGLQSNEFNDRTYYRSADGELLFGGIDGYTRFYPEDIEYDSIAPRVLIVRYTDANHKFHDLTYDKPGRLDIPWGSNSFSIGFSGLEYAHTDNLTYAYRLAGLEDDWVQCGSSRTAYFNALSPGTYQFAVRAKSSDGIWSTTPATLEIVVHPPFWRTAGFFIAIALSLLALLWLAHYYRVRVQVQRVMELERVRKNTAADFHDELGHKLTIISLFGEIVKQKLNGSAEAVGPHLDKMIATSNSLYYSMKDLLWVLDPEKDSVLDMALLLKDFGDELFERTGVAFRAAGISEELAEPLLPMKYKRHIVLIFKEVMNNALKHSNCRNVQFAVAYRPGMLQLEFKDDGKGFDLQEARSGHGINNLYDRAEKICSTLDIESHAHGTVVRLACEGVGGKHKLEIR